MMIRGQTTATIRRARSGASECDVIGAFTWFALATCGFAAVVAAFRNCGATVWESHPVAATRPPTFNFAQGMVPRA